VRQIATLYEADETIFNAVDDSSGEIGMIFKYDAVEIFCNFATKCDDKKWLMDLVLKLNQDDGYGVRDSLVHAAGKYLPNELLREMADRCWRYSESERDEPKIRHWLRLVESLASQLKDPMLFERARLKSWGEAGPAACLDIAQVYLDAGDAKTALSWIERVSKDVSFQLDERDSLLLEIYRQLGDSKSQEEIAWRTFRRYRSESTLNTLLDVIGQKKRGQVVDDATGEIMQDKVLNHFNATFLITMGRVDDAELYLMDRKDQLNGDRYSSLLEFAEVMENGQKFYAACIIYRELIDSILARAKSKYYHHGIRYLKKIDMLALKVNDWKGSISHDAYLAELRRDHFRKKAFWSQYNDV